MSVSEIIHYGVKGMKWGVRRDEAVLRRIQGQRTTLKGASKEEKAAYKKNAKEDWKKYKDSTTRSERRQDRRDADISKLEYISDHAMKQPYDLITTGAPGNIQVMMTGKEFVDTMAKGASVYARNTEITGLKIDVKKDK